MTIPFEQLEKLIDERSFGMSEYQMDNYILEAQITDSRKIRQMLLEFQGRTETLHQIKIDYKRRDLQRKKCIHDIENSEDEFEKEFLKIDLEEIEKDLKVVSRRQYNLQKEYDYFLKKISEKYDSMEELLSLLDDDDEEHKYWIARMGKQAAMDMLCLGRIGVGNMDSIAMMSEEDQVKTLSVAVQYSGLMSVGINKLQQKFQENLKQLQDSSTKVLPTFHGIEKNLDLNVPLIDELKNEQQKLSGTKEDFQFTYKPED